MGKHDRIWLLIKAEFSGKLKLKWPFSIDRNFLSQTFFLVCMNYKQSSPPTGQKYSPLACLQYIYIQIIRGLPERYRFILFFWICLTGCGYKYRRSVGTVSIFPFFSSPHHIFCISSLKHVKPHKEALIHILGWGVLVRIRPKPIKKITFIRFVWLILDDVI